MGQRQRNILIVALLVVIVCSAAASYVFVKATGASSSGPIGTGPTSHVHALIVDRDGSLILGDQHGLWRGKPAGSHWISYGSPIRNLMPICIAKLGNIMLAGTTGLSARQFGTPHGLWRSVDNGRRWQLTTVPDKDVTVLASNSHVHNTVIAVAQPDNPAGIGHGGIWASTDAGRTWRRINTSLVGKSTNGVVLLPGKPFTVLWANSQGIYRTANGGRSWKFSNLGQAQTLSLAASPLGPSTAFAGAGALGAPGSGIWVTNDAGAHWQLGWKAPPTPLLATTSDIYRQVYGYASAAKPFIYLTSPRIDKRPLSQISRGGIVPLSNAQPAVMAADPSKPGRLYAAYSFPLRIYESKDFGIKWKRIV